MENKYFMHQIKQTNGTVEKGIVVKNTMDEALQAYHAYLGAYAYGKDDKTDFVQCMITDINSGEVLAREDWAKPEVIAE